MHALGEFRALEREAGEHFWRETELIPQRTLKERSAINSWRTFARRTEKATAAL